jgi:hypothetical protein
LGRRISKGSVRPGDSTPRSQAAKYIGNGKAMRARLRARPRLTMRAARSALIRNGIGKSFTAVIGLST